MIFRIPLHVSVNVNGLVVKYGGYLGPGVLPVDYSNGDAGDVPFLES